METRTRPLLLGYIRSQVLTTADGIAEAKMALAAFAMAEGFALGTVYLEQAETAPAAFQALVDEVRCDNDVWAVVVPTAHHLTEGGLRAMRSRFEHHGTVHVVVAEAHPRPADLAS
jgi:rhamnogalacturonyl hydrolase YesR